MLLHQSYFVLSLDSLWLLLLCTQYLGLLNHVMIPGTACIQLIGHFFHDVTTGGTSPLSFNFKLKRKIMMKMMPPFLDIDDFTKSDWNCASEKALLSSVIISPAQFWLFGFYSLVLYNYLLLFYKNKRKIPSALDTLPPTTLQVFHPFAKILFFFPPGTLHQMDKWRPKEFISIWCFIQFR